MKTLVYLLFPVTGCMSDIILAEFSERILSQAKRKKWKKTNRLKTKQTLRHAREKYK